MQNPLRFARHTCVHAVLGLSILAQATVAQAAGDNCKDVRITLANRTADEIKITKLEYKDFDKNIFRTEAAFGLDGFQRLERNKSFVTVQNLEHVDNDQTQLRVTYKHRIGGTKFEDAVVVLGETFVCRDGTAITVKLNK